jgi:histidine triad (HIT) family protein
MNCIFCKILDGKIPSYKVYEDENVVAFLDISQITKGHTLVVPKKHVKNIFDMEETLASQVFVSIPKIANAIKKAFNPIGLNMINNNDKPHQSVNHFHIHLIPRYEKDRFKINFINNQDEWEHDDYLEVVEQIQKYL